MAPIGFLVLIVAALTVVASFLFMGWVVFNVVRAIMFGLLRLFGVQRPSATPTVACPQFRCGQENPVAAQFCRRCGRPMAEPVAMLPPPPAKVPRTQWHRDTLNDPEPLRIS